MSNIQVAIKIRPFLQKEREQNQQKLWKIYDNCMQPLEGNAEPYCFDHIFDQNATNQQIFDIIAKPIVASAIKGFNGTIFAYGQTSSGKTYTMIGDDGNPGITVLSIKEIFKEIAKSVDREFVLRVGYIEIYNDKVNDLLQKDNLDLKLVDMGNGEIAVVNSKEACITCEEDLMKHLNEGNKQRKFAETNMNHNSSRSHSIFRVLIESRKVDTIDDDSVQTSVLNLVDLAGSERADQSGATGSRLKEGGHINKSLMFLGKVIHALTENDGGYVNYRDSKLTRILQASLGGNAVTAIVCTIKPTTDEETMSTLSFALRAKKIENKPHVNETVQDKTMMKRLEKEISRLKDELDLERKKTESQLKVSVLERRLNDVYLKFINSESVYASQKNPERRRRTWCPSSSGNHAVPPIIPPEINKKNLNQLPKPNMFFTPQVSLIRGDGLSGSADLGISTIHEEFVPAEEVNFDDVTPINSPRNSMNIIRRVSITPKMDIFQRVDKVERDFEELQNFTNLETHLKVQHDNYGMLKKKLEDAEQAISRLEQERAEYAFWKDQYSESEENLNECRGRCDVLQDEVTAYSKEISELKNKIHDLEKENQNAVSLEFEFKQLKKKSELRESELLNALEEKQFSITKLEKTVQALSAQLTQNHKEPGQLHKSEVQYEEIQKQYRILEEKFEKLQADATANALQYAAFEEINNQLQSDNQSLLDEIKAKTLMLKESKEETNSSRVQLMNLQAEYDKMQEKYEKQNNTIEKIQDQYNKIQEKYEILQEKYEDLEKNSISSVKDYASLQEANEALQNEISKLKSNVEQTQTMLLDPCESSYQNNFDNQNNEDFIEIQSKYNEMVKDYEETSNQLVDSLQDLEELKGKYNCIEAELNTLKEQQSDLNALKSELKTCEEKYQILKDEFEKKDSFHVLKMNELENKFAKENLEKNESIESLQKELNNYRCKINMLQNQLDMKNSELKNVNQIRKSLSANIIIDDQCEEEDEETESTLIEKLQTNLESTLDAFEDLQKAKNDADLLLKKSCQEKSQLQDKIANLITKYENCQKENANVTQENADLRINCEKFEKEIDNLKISIEKDKQDFEKIYQRLQTKNCDLQNIIDSLSDENQNIRHTCKNLQKAIHNLEKEMLTLRAEKHEADEMCETLQKNFLDNEEHELEKEFDHLHSENLQKEKLSIENERDTLLREKTELSDEKNNLIREKNDLIEEKEKLLHAIGDLQKQNKNLISENNIILKDVRNLKEKNEYFENQINIFIQNSNDKEMLLKQLQQKYDEKNVENEKLQSNIENIKNDYEKSKKVLSDEIAMLKTIVDSYTNNLQKLESKNTDLSSKIKTLSDDLNLAQAKVIDYDDVFEKYMNLKSKFDDNLSMNKNDVILLKSELKLVKKQLAEECASLKKRSIDLASRLNESELSCKTLSENHVELVETNKALQEKLNKAEKDVKRCEQLRLELDSLKHELIDREKNLAQLNFENQKIINSKVDLRAKLDATIKEAATDIDRFQVEILELSQCKLQLSEEVKRLTTSLHYKESTSMAEKEKLKNSLAALTSENKIFEEKLYEANAIIRRLQQELKDLKHIQSSSTSITTDSTADKRLQLSADKSIDNLLSENHQLKIKNKSLMEKLDLTHNKISVNEERKNRRMSTHDERRRQSLLNVSSHDISIMTDATELKCNCAEFERQLNDCKRTLLIRDSQLSKLSMEMKNNPLKAENQLLKKRIQSEDDTQRQLRIEIKKYKQLLERANQAAAEAIALVGNKSLNNVEIQTSIDNDEMVKLIKVTGKYEDLKKLCRARMNQIIKLQQETEELTKYKKKYDELKIVFNYRGAEIERLKSNTAQPME